jgi:hypothetical protein
VSLLSLGAAGQADPLAGEAGLVGDPGAGDFQAVAGGKAPGGDLARAGVQQVAGFLDGFELQAGLPVLGGAGMVGIHDDPVDGAGRAAVGIGFGHGPEEQAAAAGGGIAGEITAQALEGIEGDFDADDADGAAVDVEPAHAAAQEDAGAGVGVGIAPDGPVVGGVDGGEIPGAAGGVVVGFVAITAKSRKPDQQARFRTGDGPLDVAPGLVDMREQAVHPPQTPSHVLHRDPVLLVPRPGGAANTGIGH